MSQLAENEYKNSYFNCFFFFLAKKLTAEKDYWVNEFDSVSMRVSTSGRINGSAPES